MAFDPILAQRLRKALGHRRDVEEKRMFGGLCFMVAGKMTAGVLRDDLVLKVGPEGYEAALAQSHVRPMDFTGRPMKGMVYVAPAGVATESALHAWVRRATGFNASTPAKIPKAKAAGRSAGRKVKAPVKSGKSGPAQGIPTFAGFPPAAFAFLRGIAQHNSKPWFQAHQDEYRALYDTGMALAAALGPKLAQVSPLIRFEPRINGSVFRIQRDIRFSKDKTPYKPHLTCGFGRAAKKAGTCQAASSACTRGA